MNSTHRFEALDGLRGVAALMVAVFHFNSLHHLYFVPLVRNSYLLVDFFFVLSGFVIAHAYGERLRTLPQAASFAVRRLGRVWPLHATILAVMIAFEGLRSLAASVGAAAHDVPGFDPSGVFPLAHIPYHLTLTQALHLLPDLAWNSPSWSISVEYWSYLVFAAIALALPSTFRLAAMAALVIVSVAVLMAIAPSGLGSTFDFGLLRCFIGFFCGVTVYAVRKTTTDPTRRWISTAEPCAALAGLAFLHVIDQSLFVFLTPLVFAAIVYVFSFGSGPLSKALTSPFVKTLGLHSYSIYMVQVPLLILINMVERILLPDTTTVMIDHHLVFVGYPAALFDGVLVAYLVAVVILAGLTYRTIEQPGQRVFNRLAARLTALDVSWRHRATNAVAG